MMKLGIFGFPVRQSLSPLMQEAALRAVGLDWTYELLEVLPEGFAAALDALRAVEWRGANVTIPHKEAAAGAVDRLEGEAQAIGAVNTIVVEGGRLIGHNTDALGFLDAAGDVRDAICAVLGAGGSARAIVYALRKGGAREIRVLSRRRIFLPASDRVFGWEEAGLARANLLVSCVPREVAPPRLDAVAEGARIIDLTYGAPSAIAHAAAGRPYQDGCEMLVRQGAHAFELFTGRTAPIEIMRQVVVRAAGIR